MRRPVGCDARRRAADARRPPADRRTATAAAAAGPLLAECFLKVSVISRGAP